MATVRPIPGVDTRVSNSVPRGRRRRVAMGALAGALVLGAAGAALSATQDVPDSASALVFSAPDPTVVDRVAAGLSGGDPARRNTTFLETELARLHSADLAEQVRRSLTGSGSLDLEATRVGESNVLEITATHSDARTAVRQAQAAADVYSLDRQSRLAERIDGLTAAIDEEIAATDAAITALGAPPATGADLDERQREALQRQYAGQFVTRDLLQRELATVGQSAVVVQDAAPLPGGRLPAGVTTTLGTASIGAIGGSVLLALAGSLRSRVRDEEDVAALGAPLVSPSLPRGHGSPESLADLERAVQLQTLQLPAGPAAGGSLAVLGPTAGVGATFTAVQHALHAARRRRTLLISAEGRSGALDHLGLHTDDAGSATPDGPPGPTGAPVRGARRTSVPGLYLLTFPTEADPAGIQHLLVEALPAAAAAGWAVVVHSPPLDRSPIGVSAARWCAERVLVAAVGRSTVDDVERALRVLRSEGVRPGVVVNHPPRSIRRLSGSGSHTSRALPGRAARPVHTTTTDHVELPGDDELRRGRPA